MRARVAQPERLNGHDRRTADFIHAADRAGSASMSTTQHGDYAIDRIFFSDRISESEFMLTKRLRQAGSGKLDRPYTQHEWIYAAVSAKATEFASVPMRVRRKRRGDDTDEGVLVPQDAGLAALLDNPNPNMTGVEFRELISIALDLWGELFGVMFTSSGDPFEPGPGRVPAEIHPVSPGQMKPIIENRIVVGWWFEWKTPEGETKKTRLTDDQVMQFRELNPYMPVRGLGPAQVVSRSARTDLKAGRYTEALLDNGADPGGTLVTDDFLTRAQAAELRNEWNDRHAGETKQGRIAVLQGGMKYVPNPVTIKDMQFPEQRKWTREGILAAFRVPKMLLGLIDDVNRSTAREVLKMWWTNVMIPRQNKVASVYNDSIYAAVGDGSQLVYCVEFDNANVEALQEDLGEKLDNANKMKELGYPVNMINQRLSLGMEDLEWGDEVLATATLVPVSELVNAPGAFLSTGTTAEGRWYESTRRKVYGEAEAVPVPMRAIVCDTRYVDPDDMPRGKDFAALSTDQKMWWYDRAFFRPNEQRVRRALSRTYRELRKEQIERLRRWADGTLKSWFRSLHDWEQNPAEQRAPRIPKLTAEEVNRILIGPKAWSDALTEGLGVEMNGVTAGALAQVEGELGAFQVVDPADEAWSLRTGKRLGQMVKLGVQDRKTVRAILIQFIDQPVNLREIELSLVQGFTRDIMPPWRATTIARTETGILTGQIRNESFKQEGIKEHEWVTRQDEHVRPAESGGSTLANHRLLNGQKREIGKKFSNGLLHPSDPNGPPEEIINCRCTAFAVPELEI